MECVQTVMPGFLLLEVSDKTGFRVQRFVSFLSTFYSWEAQAVIEDCIKTVDTVE